jgi:hypothetical protein
MSDIFKKAVAADLQKNFNVKNPTQVLEKNVVNKFETPTTPEPVTPSTPTKETKAPAVKTPTPPKSAAPAGTPITPENMDKFFGASPGVTQEQIQKAKPVPAIKKPLTQTKQDKAILNNVQKQFTSKEILPYVPVSLQLTGGLKDGEIVYFDYAKEEEDRKNIQKSIDQAIKTNTNLVTKKKLTEKEKNELIKLSSDINLITKVEDVESGLVGTDDMSTWKRTSGDVFQQPIKPIQIIDTKSKKKLSDRDFQYLELLQRKNQEPTKFQSDYFGEEYAKQEEEKKKEQYVFGKALESGKAGDLIKQQEEELKKLQEELKKNEAELKEAEAEDLKTSQFEYEQNQSFFNTGVKYSPKAARLKAQNKVDQYSAVPELFAKNVNLQQQINSKKEVIANPFRKNKAETAAAGELFNYLNKQQELLLSPEEQKELAQTRAIQARQAVEEKFKRTGFRDSNTSDKSSVMFYTNTGNTILIKKGDVKNVFKTIFNNAYGNISSSTDTKNLRTYAELAAYVTKFPNSEFSKKIQELGEEKGKALGFQGDWLPDVVKKRQAFDYQGNLGGTMGFSDDPIAIYAASLNPYDRSNPLLDKWKTTGYFSNFMKEFLVNSSLEADKNYIGAQRLNRQIEQDRYTLVTRPGLVKQIDEAKKSGDLKKAEELEYVLSTKEEKHRAFVEKNLKEDERDQTLLKSIEARTGTKGELGKEYAAKKEAGSTMYNLAQPTRDLLEFMAPVMIMELATMGMATPAVGALATQRTAAAIASRILKAAPTIYSRYNESTMEVGGAQTALYNEQLDDLLNKNGIELTASASTMDKEKALSNAGVTPEKLAIARLNTTVGSNSLFWKNMALAIPDLVQMDFLASTLLNTEKKIAEGALKVAAREKFLNLTIKGVGFKVPLKQTGNLALEGYLKSYLPEKFEEGIQYAFGKTYERDARGFNPPTFFNAMGSFVKDAFDAATSINFVPGVSHTNLGGTYSDDKEFQMSADIGGFLGGATAGLGIVKSTMNAAWSFNKAHNQLTEIGFYDPNFSVDRISAASFKALLDSGKLEYHMKLIADQKSKLQENGEVNKIYNYSKEDLRKIQDDPELENLKQLQAELGDRASSELNDTVNFLQRETFLNKVYENGLSPAEQYDRFIAQLGRAQEIYNASLDNLSNVRSDKFFSSVNQDVRNFADTLSDAERTRYLKSFGGKTRIKNRLEQTIAEHAFSLARAEQDIKHVDKIINDFINKPNQKSFFDIPGLNQLFYDEMLVASKEDQLDTLEIMVDLDPNADPQLKERAKQFKKSLRAERLRINREFENIKSNLKEPLEGDTKKPSLKEQQQYLDQFVVSGEGFTRLNREKIRETQGLVDPVILDLMKEKSRRSDTATFASSQLEKLSKIKTASELGSWYNTSLTNVEKQLIKDRANRLKELEQKEEIITPEEEKEKAELRDALDIPEDATTEEVNAAIGDAISETESDVDPVAVTDTAIILDENFDFTALPSNPMTKVMLGSYPLANVRGIKTRIKNNEVFTITEVNNQQGYFKVTTNDGKTTVMIPIKGGPLDGTSTVGTPVEPTSQEKLDDIVISVEAPTIVVTDVPTTTEPVISEDIKNIQSTTVDQVLERLKILNSKKFKVNPEDENTYIEVDDNGTPVKDENGNVTVYARVSTLKGGDKPTDKKPANRGTIIDTLLRDFINNQFPSFESMLQAYNSNSLKNETQEFTPTFIKNLFDLFTDFKKSTDAAGIQLISDIPTLWGKLAGSTFAGTIDLMGIGKDGSVYIIDLKTAFKNRREVYENNDPSDRYYGFYVEGDSLQQSCYAELLRQRTGITISSLGILPIQITLENNKHTSAKPNMSKAGKFTIPVKINRTIFPEIIEPIEDQQEGPFTEPTIETPTITPTVQPEVIATTQQTPAVPVSDIEAKKADIENNDFVVKIKKIGQSYAGGKQFVNTKQTGKEFLEQLNYEMYGEKVQPEHLLYFKDKFGGQLYDLINRGYKELTGKTFEEYDAELAALEGPSTSDKKTNPVNWKKGDEIIITVSGRKVSEYKTKIIDINTDGTSFSIQYKDVSGNIKTIDNIDETGVFEEPFDTDNGIFRSVELAALEEAPTTAIEETVEVKLADLPTKTIEAEVVEETPTTPVSDIDTKIANIKALIGEIESKRKIATTESKSKGSGYNLQSPGMVISKNLFGKVNKVTGVLIDAFQPNSENNVVFSTTANSLPEYYDKVYDYYDTALKQLEAELSALEKASTVPQSIEVENTIEDPFTIDEKFLGKLVYSSSTSGKSALASKSNNVTDADKLLEEAIEEAEPSINFSLMSEKEKKEALFNVYTIPGLYNKVKPLFINKIKDALAKKKLVVSANGMVREALPNELKIDYVFLHNDPSEFVKRSTDRGERAFNEKSAQTRFDQERTRFPQADFYYPSGVTITDVVRSGSTVQMSVPSAIEEIPTPTATTVQPTTEVMSTQPTPVKPRPKVDARLNLRYNFANGITVSRADREESEMQQKEFLYGTEEDQLEFSILATEVSPRIMKKFEAMGFKSNSKNIPIEMISDSDFNPNGLTESQTNALINGQPIIIAVNDVYGKRFRLGKDGQHSLNFGSPYTLVYIKPSRVGVEVNGVPQLDQSALTATLFNPNDFSTTELATLLKFSGDKSIASDETIRSFVTRFNNAIKLHKALNKIPSNTPLKLKDVKDVIKIKSSLGELNLINTRTNITNLPESMLYPFGKEKGIVIVNLNSDRSKTNYYNKDAITQMEANEINKIPLGNELGFKLIIKHSDPKKGLLYVDIDVPRGESPSTAGANLVGIIRGIVSEMVKKGISSNVSVSTYNGQMENIFGTHGKISITSTSLKGVFFNLKVQPDTMKFVLEVKTRRADGTYLFDSVGITELLASNIQSTEEFVKFLYDNLSNASLKALFEKPESFKISTVGVTIDAIIDTAQTRLSTTDPFKNPSIIANLVSDIESSTLANINMVKENVVSSLEDNTVDEGSEIDYVQQFEDNVLSLNQIAVTQLLKRNGKTLNALKEFIRENKVIVTEYDQIPDILTKMC